MLLQELYQNLGSKWWRAVCFLVPQSWLFKAQSEVRPQPPAGPLLPDCKMWHPFDHPQRGQRRCSAPRSGRNLWMTPIWTRLGVRNTCGLVSLQDSFLHLNQFTWPRFFFLLPSQSPTGSSCDGLVPTLSSPAGNHRVRFPGETEHHIHMRKQEKKMQGEAPSTVMWKYEVLWRFSSVTNIWELAGWATNRKLSAPWGTSTSCWTPCLFPVQPYHTWLVWVAPGYLAKLLSPLPWWETSDTSSRLHFWDLSACEQGHGFSWELARQGARHWTRTVLNI